MRYADTSDTRKLCMGSRHMLRAFYYVCVLFTCTLDTACTAKMLLCTTGEHAEVNRVCMRTEILMLSFGAAAYVDSLSCEDTRIWGPGFNSSLLSEEHSFNGKSCIEGRCRSEHALLQTV
jgi:hypothetical protein